MLVLVVLLVDTHSTLIRSLINYLLSQVYKL
jgi:hypothetical protein